MATFDRRVDNVVSGGRTATLCGAQGATATNHAAVGSPVFDVNYGIAKLEALMPLIVLFTSTLITALSFARVRALRYHAPKPRVAAALQGEQSKRDLVRRDAKSR